MLEYKEKQKKQEELKFIEKLDENLEELAKLLNEIKALRKDFSQRTQRMQAYKANLQKENTKLKRLRMRIGKRR